jgi:hypothetical protein
MVRPFLFNFSKVIRPPNENYGGRSSQTETVNFTGIKRDASVAVLHAVVSGKCVLLLIGGAHVAGQSRDR